MDYNEKSFITILIDEVGRFKSKVVDEGYRKVLLTEEERENNLLHFDTRGKQYQQFISISEIKELIELAESNGSNFVSIDTEYDHDSGHTNYVVDGYLLRKETIDEALEKVRVSNERYEKAKQEEIRRLEERLERLKNN